MAGPAMRRADGILDANSEIYCAQLVKEEATATVMVVEAEA